MIIKQYSMCGNVFNIVAVVIKQKRENLMDGFLFAFFLWWMDEWIDGWVDVDG